MTIEAGGRTIAAAPVFRTSYRLDTPFQGPLRRMTDRLYSRNPRLVSLPVLGIGSPMSDSCSLGIAHDLDPAGRAAALGALIDGLIEVGNAEKSAILAVKSLGPDALTYADVLEARGFGRVTSVPVVMLPLPYVSLNHYLASLPEKTGSYLRRKFRAATKVRIEYRTSIRDIEPLILALYGETLKQSAVDYGEFDQLHPDYFSTLLEGLGDRARLMLCWRGDELLSFQLFLIGENRIIANKIGMKYPEAREFNLYFVNWLKMIEFAIERGIPEIEMGATTYAAKLLFGGFIDRRWLCFRFRGTVVNALTKPLHRFFDFERNDPELQKLASRTG
jgi:predicted N-acyltransferase